ncbi:MAG: hypothetical protein WCX95_01685 [Candidatus Gracilibacteria bacterium]
MEAKRYSLEGAIPYKEAVNAVQELTEAGIRANLTVGGISLELSQAQLTEATEIAARYHGAIVEGLTGAQEQVFGGDVDAIREATYGGRGSRIPEEE